MSEKHPECPLYNPLNCKEYYNPKLCAFVKKDKICLKKKENKKESQTKKKTEIDGFPSIKQHHHAAISPNVSKKILNKLKIAENQTCEICEVKKKVFTMDRRPKGIMCLNNSCFRF